MSTVLVVDDHPDLGTALVRLLKLSGHDAVAVMDGESALAFVHSTPPSMVILDAMMPGLSGYDVLAALRADPTTKALPVVMFSALSGAHARLKAMELGAQDYLVKSVATYDDVAAAVERFVRPPS